MKLLKYKTGRTKLLSLKSHSRYLSYKDYQLPNYFNINKNGGIYYEK